MGHSDPIRATVGIANGQEGDGGPECRNFAQLGVVMVGSHDSTTWFRTEFVLVAELDECARAESLWIIQNPHCQTNLDNLDHQHHFDFMHWKFAAFENYGVFGFDQINNDMPKASRLSCVGGEEWHRIGEMLERRDAQGLLLLSILTWATQWDPSHFVMLARRTQDGRFEHATVVLSNPPTSAAQIKRARARFGGCGKTGSCVSWRDSGAEAADGTVAVVVEAGGVVVGGEQAVVA
ncbi:hypothetical protein DHEL01_v206420 [Diaporthe helianthi]|uniref:Uncharacterized protein n=1 Tax=Diaporthe helianthi TaxID=158607 RepID=A0A2P5HY60_DIAHE|nr:hypothetical protein DHEL01_v206420 [Diaporthe helianthi]